MRLYAQTTTLEPSFDEESVISFNLKKKNIDKQKLNNGNGGKIFLYEDKHYFTGLDEFFVI